MVCRKRSSVTVRSSATIPAKHRDFSAVTHVAKDKGIPPFLILHVADHPDTTAQAQRLGDVLKEAGIPVTVFGAKETTHNKINADLGLPDDPATKALFEFVNEALEEVIIVLARIERLPPTCQRSITSTRRLHAYVPSIAVPVVDRGARLACVGRRNSRGRTAGQGLRGDQSQAG